MQEYAILTTAGHVINMVTTKMPLAQLREHWPENRVLPVSEVPLRTLEAYQYWNERP